MSQSDEIKKSLETIKKITEVSEKETELTQEPEKPPPPNKTQFYADLFRQLKRSDTDISSPEAENSETPEP